MILGVPVPTEGLSALAFEVDRGRIEEHQIQTAEQIPATGKQRFFDHVLGGARQDVSLLLEAAALEFSGKQVRHLLRRQQFKQFELRAHVVLRRDDAAKTFLHPNPIRSTHGGTPCVCSGAISRTIASAAFLAFRNTG